MKRFIKILASDNNLVYVEGNSPKSEKLASVFNKLKIVASLATLFVIIPSFFYESEKFDLFSNIFLFIFYVFALIEIYFHYEDSKEHLKNMILKNMLPVMSFVLIATYFGKYFSF